MTSLIPLKHCWSRIHDASLQVNPCFITPFSAIQVTYHIIITFPLYLQIHFPASQILQIALPIILNLSAVSLSAPRIYHSHLQHLRSYHQPSSAILKPPNAFTTNSVTCTTHLLTSTKHHRTHTNSPTTLDPSPSSAITMHLHIKSQPCLPPITMRCHSCTSQPSRFTFPRLCYCSIKSPPTSSTFTNYPIPPNHHAVTTPHNNPTYNMHFHVLPNNQTLSLPHRALTSKAMRQLHTHVASPRPP